PRDALPGRSVGTVASPNLPVREGISLSRHAQILKAIGGTAMSKSFEIGKTVVLETTPEQVWRAIATPEGQRPPGPRTPTSRGRDGGVGHRERAPGRAHAAGREGRLPRVRVP